MDEMNRTIIDTNGGWGGNAMAQQTQAIINALKPTATTGA